MRDGLADQCGRLTQGRGRAVIVSARMRQVNAL
jgi:hypothetical protein